MYCLYCVYCPLSAQCLAAAQQAVRTRVFRHDTQCGMKMAIVYVGQAMLRSELREKGASWLWLSHERMHYRDRGQIGSFALCAGSTQGEKAVA